MLYHSGQSLSPPPLMDQKKGTTPADVPKSQGTVRRVTLVAGDSYAARLDAAKLGKGKADVVNIAEGGARMDKVQKQLEQLVSLSPDLSRLSDNIQEKYPKDPSC